MRTMRRRLARLTSPASGVHSDERVQAEIEEHLAQLTAENERAGMPRDHARRALKFRGVECTPRP